MCLQEGVIENPTDGDLGAVMGLGFPPFLGGPFRALDTMGSAEYVKRMDRLAEKHGRRFDAAPLVRDHAKRNKKFHAG
ncbi:MAG: hypothetical protein M5R36_25505 [Deltaproteobacteria bacterium]|nr:hypothetical protein [Deltaproteobacteria bacterium]